VPETAERFKKTIRGKIVSSRGFSVRIAGPTGLDYEDAGAA
jgi:hypothetical protein